MSGNIIQMKLNERCSTPNIKQDVSEVSGEVSVMIWELISWEISDDQIKNAILSIVSSWNYYAFFHIEEEMLKHYKTDVHDISFFRDRVDRIFQELFYKWSLYMDGVYIKSKEK